MLTQAFYLFLSFYLSYVLKVDSKPPKKKEDKPPKKVEPVKPAKKAPVVEAPKVVEVPKVVGKSAPKPAKKSKNVVADPTGKQIYFIKKKHYFF